MAEISHFEYGWITPAVGYALSVIGSLLGLVCAGRIRGAAGGRQRAWWVILAAWALGGTAIWTMHFMAMLGFAVRGTQIRYDVPITVASAVIAVVAVGIGLIVATTGRAGAARLIGGGIITGLGVAAMHYTGMAAMHLHGTIGYDPVLVVASVLIAVVAATVALWLGVTVRRPVVLFGSALVMGVAISGMHYTGMAGMSVTPSRTPGALAGATVSSLLVPILLAVIFVVIGLVYALLVAPTEQDRRAAAYFDSLTPEQPAPAEAVSRPGRRRAGDRG